MAKSKRSIRAGRGALLVLSGMLFTSGIIRLSGETGQAVAREVQELAAGSGKTSANNVSCTPEPDILALLSALQGRELRVVSKEGKLADRVQALSVAEKRIEARLAQLVEVEATLARTISQVDSASEGDLARLTTVYESMKPKDASALFEEMAPDFAAGFLGRMRPDAAAAIMAGLAPETAYTISVVLAGRNADVPRSQ